MKNEREHLTLEKQHIVFTLDQPINSFGTVSICKKEGNCFDYTRHEAE